MKQIARQLATGLKGMHDAGVVHRDLKLENIFMKGEGTDVKAVIGDFGFATIVGDKDACHGRYGSRGYTAPEVLIGQKYGRKSDVFSLACILYALASAELPHYSDDLEDYFEKTCFVEVDFTEAVWGNYSAKFKDLIRKMLIKDQDKRLDIN